MVDLVDRSTGDIISSADQNLMVDYIEDGTHRVHTLYTILEPTTEPAATKGALYYDSTDDLFYGCTDGSTFSEIGGGGTGNFLPSVSDTYNIGSDTYKWNDAVFSGSVHLHSTTNVDSLHCTMNENAISKYAMRVEATAAAKTQVNGPGGVYLDGGAGMSIYAYRNSDQAYTTDPMVQIIQANAGDDQRTLYVSTNSTSVGAVNIVVTGNANSAAMIVNDTSAGAGTNYCEFSRANDSGRATF
jgi:hypothetical protein